MIRSLLLTLLRGFIFFFKTKGLYVIPLTAVIYLIIFWFSPDLLNYLQNQFGQKFVFFTVSEPILSLLKFSFAILFIVIYPFFFAGFLYLLQPLLGLKSLYLLLFYLLGLILFYSGILFSYFITIPYGIKFLLSFKTESLEPAISLTHFVNFFSFFLLTFGLVFELPLFLALFSILKIIDPKKIARYRKEIFFFIVLFSAIVTPTPDAINMSLLAIPIYLLFELGLFLGIILRKLNILSEDVQKVPQQEQQPSQGA